MEKKQKLKATFYVDNAEEYRAYKAHLVQSGKSISEDLNDHIRRTIKKGGKKDESK